MRKTATGWAVHGDVSTCKYCGEMIMWQKSKAGKWYALNVVETSIDGFNHNSGKKIGWASGGNFHKCAKQ